MDFENLTIKEASEALKEKKITVVELVDFFVQNAKSKNEEFNIYLEIFDDIDKQVKTAQDRHQRSQEGVATLVRDHTGDDIAHQWQ